MNSCVCRVGFVSFHADNVLKDMQRISRSKRLDNADDEKGRSSSQQLEFEFEVLEASWTHSCMPYSVLRSSEWHKRRIFFAACDVDWRGLHGQQMCYSMRFEQIEIGHARHNKHKYSRCSNDFLGQPIYPIEFKSLRLSARSALQASAKSLPTHRSHHPMAGETTLTQTQQPFCPSIAARQPPLHCLPNENNIEKSVKYQMRQKHILMSESNVRMNSYAPTRSSIGIQPGHVANKTYKWKMYARTYAAHLSYPKYNS